MLLVAVGACRRAVLLLVHQHPTHTRQSGTGVSPVTRQSGTGVQCYYWSTSIQLTHDSLVLESVQCYYWSTSIQLTHDSLVLESSDTTVWYWSADRASTMTVMYSTYNRELWCNGSTITNARVRFSRPSPPFL